jgi:CxxC-x17-CxxC domain-containing protein
MTRTLTEILRREEAIQMTFEEKSIVCTDCGVTFTHSIADQEFFQTKGYTNEPRRCTTCRAAKRSQAGNSNTGYSNTSYAPRQMYPATCADCGKATEVPFEPRSGKPVYCSDCFRKVRA